MIKDINKLISVVQTEGIRGTSDRAIKLILSWFGFRISETLCYKFSFDFDDEIKEMIIHPSLQGIKVKVFKTLDEFRRFTNFPIKIAFLDIEKWFLREAICLSLVYDLKVIAYTWLHPKQYYIENMGTFYLREQENYFGPAFTDRHFRRRGLYHLLIGNSLKYSKENGIKHVFSSSSIENTFSIKGLVGCGFKVVGCVRSKSQKNREILEFNKEKIVSQRLE